MYLLNAFSVNMLDVPENAVAGVSFKRLTTQQARDKVQQMIGPSSVGARPDEIISAVGHEDTARVFSAVLGIEVPCNRTTVQLHPYLDYAEQAEYDLRDMQYPPRRDYALLGQYKGPRLPEGATALPEGATIEWYMVFLEDSLVPTAGEDRY